MTKKSRDYLFWLFIIVFVISTVIISLYASGYKFNLSWPPKFNRLLVKTGMMIIKSQPDNATVYLNGQAQTNFTLLPWKKNEMSTPAKIKNVLPGEYDLKLVHEGYWPFEKKITVYSGQTTFLEDINLFRSNLPTLITAASSSNLELSSSKRYLYSSGTAQIIDLKNEQQWALPIKTDGDWLKNSDKLLAAGQIFNATNRDNINYQQLLGSDAKNWYEDENNNRLYYQNKNSLNYWEINKATNTVVLSGRDYSSYEPRGENIFLVTSDGKNISLQAYSLKTQSITQSLNLPAVGSYNLMADNADYLTLYDRQNQTLYLLNPASIASDPKIIKNVIDWAWINNNTLVYNNNWEIYQFDLKRGTNTLLTRVGQEIKKIIWNKSASYLLFTTDKNLNAFDLKTGIITNILQTDKIVSPVLDEKNDVLYFWAQIGQQSGIYKMLLQ